MSCQVCPELNADDCDTKELVKGSCGCPVCDLDFANFNNYLMFNCLIQECAKNAGEFCGGLWQVIRGHPVETCLLHNLVTWSSFKTTWLQLNLAKLSQYDAHAKTIFFYWQHLSIHFTHHTKNVKYHMFNPKIKMDGKCSSCHKCEKPPGKG